MWAGNDGTAFNYNKHCSLYRIQIQLTKEGFANVDKVLDIVFEYLELLRKTPPKQQYYDEERRIAQLNFDLNDANNNAVKTTTELAETMLKGVPSERILTYGIPSRFDPELIKSCIDALSHDKVCILLSSNDVKGQKKEKYFKTEFAVEEVPAKWKSYWKSPNPPKEMHLPLPNKYLVDDLKLRPLDVTLVMEHPIRVVGEDQGELFYKRDVTFGKPEAYVYFRISSHKPFLPIRDIVCLELWVS